MGVVLEESDVPLAMGSPSGLLWSVSDSVQSLSAMLDVIIVMAISNTYLAPEYYYFCKIDLRSDFLGVDCSHLGLQLYNLSTSYSVN